MGGVGLSDFIYSSYGWLVKVDYLQGIHISHRLNRIHWKYKQSLITCLELSPIDCNTNTVIVKAIIVIYDKLISSLLCEHEGVPGNWRYLSSNIFHVFIYLLNLFSKQLIFISLSELIVFNQINDVKKTIHLPDYILMKEPIKFQHQLHPSKAQPSFYQRPNLETVI